MEATKLKSGNWRVVVYIGKDDTGKKKYQSITREKKQDAIDAATLLRADVLNGKVKPTSPKNLTVEEACQKFLDNVDLSPSTQRGYMWTFNKYVKPDKIALFKLSELTTAVLTEWVNKRMPKDLSGKSKKNHVGFIIAVVNYHLEDERRYFKVKIRDTSPKDLYMPTDDDIDKVLAVADPVLERAMLLGNYSLRRGEICALTAADVDRKNCRIRVNKALSKSPTGEWVLKEPKTKSSIRWVDVDRDLIDKLPKEGRIVPVSPDVITLRFIKAVQRASVTKFRFHDLRAHFVASARREGYSQKTVQQVGGWAAGSPVMEKNYNRPIEDERTREEKKKIVAMQSKFSSISRVREA